MHILLITHTHQVSNLLNHGTAIKLQTSPPRKPEDVQRTNNLTNLKINFHAVALILKIIYFAAVSRNCKNIIIYRMGSKLKMYDLGFMKMYDLGVMGFASVKDQEIGW